VPLPSQLDHAHVAQVRDLTRRLDETTITYGSSPEVSSAAASAATRLLAVSGPEPIKRAALVAVAELHIQAGWAGFDAVLYRRALRHYAIALDLARRAGDVYAQALALNYAGLATIEHGEPDDGLKMLQAARVKTWDIPTNGRMVTIGEGTRVAVEACGLADSATALAELDQTPAACQHLAMARELWIPASGDAAGDLDRPAAELESRRGRLDVAEALATASVRRWEGNSLVCRAQSAIVLATIYVRAGEPRGPQLAHSAITDTAKLSSVRARRRLVPLAEVLETWPSSDAKDLARMARQVAA
jgi:hypothetical protein